MRSAGNFNPEWGYLAPAPSFMRTMRVVLVATAIGATAGAAVVISLIDRPTGRGDETASVTPRAIVTSAQAAPAAEMPAAAASVAAPVEKTAVEPAMAPPSAGASAIVPQTAPAVSPQVMTPPAAALPLSADNASVPPIAPSQPSLHAAVPDNSTASDAVAVPKHSTGMAALSEASPSSEAMHAADESDQALIPPEPIPAEKKAKHHVASAAATDGRNRPASSLGSVLRRIFNPRSAGTSYYPNH
jgi:hypothetical protein